MNAKAQSKISVVGICGSLRGGSHTRMALRIALEGAQEVGAEIKLIDLRDYGLNFCDGKEDESGYPPVSGSFARRYAQPRASSSPRPSTTAGSAAC